MHEAMLELADGKEANLAAIEGLASLQLEPEAAKHELAVERQAHKAATQSVKYIHTE